MSKKHLITVAGRPGSGKSSAAKGVASALDYTHFSSGDFFRSLGKQGGMDVLQANLSAEDSEAQIDHLVDQKLIDIGQQEDKYVIDSRMAWHWMPHSFKVFLDLDLETAATRIISKMTPERMEHEHIPEDPRQYAKVLEERMASEMRRYRKLYDVDPSNLLHYDLIIDTKENDLDKVIALILEGFTAWQD